MSTSLPPIQAQQQPGKKAGFFRRLSLSANASSRPPAIPPQPHPQSNGNENASSAGSPSTTGGRSNRVVSGGSVLIKKDKNEYVFLAGPAYEALPPAAHSPLPLPSQQLLSQAGAGSSDEMNSHPVFSQDSSNQRQSQNPQPLGIGGVGGGKIRIVSRDKTMDRDYQNHASTQPSTNFTVSPLLATTSRSPPPNISSLPSPPPAVPPIPSLPYQSQITPVQAPYQNYNSPSTRGSPGLGRPSSMAASGSRSGSGSGEAYTPRAVSHRNPIAPMLASPPASPPQQDYEVPTIPTAVMMNGGRFPTPVNAIAQSYSRVPLLGMQQLPARSSSSAAAAVRVNGDSRRQATVPPGAAPTYEIIASSPGRKQPQSPPSSLPSPPPVIPTVPQLPTSISHGRFDDAEVPSTSPSTNHSYNSSTSHKPFPEPFSTLPNGAQAPGIPGQQGTQNTTARPRAHTRRSSSQNRGGGGQKAIVSAPEVKRQLTQVQVETLDGDNYSAHQRSSNSFGQSRTPPSSFIAPSPSAPKSSDISFPTRQSMASSPTQPATPENFKESLRQQQQPQPRTPKSSVVLNQIKPFSEVSPPVSSQSERRLSRPLPRPPSTLIQAQTPPKSTSSTPGAPSTPPVSVTSPPPYPNSSIQISPTPRQTFASTTTTARKSISPTTSKATMHVIASSSGSGRKDSGVTSNSDSVESRTNTITPSSGPFADQPVQGQMGGGPQVTAAKLPIKPEKNPQRSMSPVRPKIIIPNSNVSSSDAQIPSIVATQPTPAKSKQLGFSQSQPQQYQPHPSNMMMANDSDPFTLVDANGGKVVSLDLNFDFPKSPSIVPLVDPQDAAEKKQSNLPGSSSGLSMQNSTSSYQMSTESSISSDSVARETSPTIEQHYLPRRVSSKPGSNGLLPILPSPPIPGSDDNINGQSSQALNPSQLPPRVSSAQGRRVASSPLASPVFSSPGQMSGNSHTFFQAYSPQQQMMIQTQQRAASSSYPSPASSRPVSHSTPNAARTRLGVESKSVAGGGENSSVGSHGNDNASFSRRGSAADTSYRQSSMMITTNKSSFTQPRPMQRRRPQHLSLKFLLGEPAIANSFLPYLSINMFLNLLGSDDEFRKVLTGDMIGRWVFREWGVVWDPERSRTRPGLTVWEGFLESLLHDPAVYCTYPPQYHSLLQHLSLSHTLIVLYLRELPPSFFPFSSPPPFDEELGLPPVLSSSIGSFSGGPRSRSRMGSAAGSDAGSIAPGSIVSGKMPRQERVVEIVMPEPLAPQAKAESSEPSEELISDVVGGSGPSGALRKARRRGSVSSIASTSSFTFGRRRANSTTSAIRADLATTATGPAAQYAAPMLQGKQELPPVSYPSAKRYGFRRHGGDSIPVPRSRTSSESGRPGSIMSVQSSPSMSHHPRMSSSYSRSSMAMDRYSFAVDRNAPPVPGLPPHLPVPPIIGSAGGHRASFASSEAGKSSRRSDQGGASSPIGRKWGGDYSPNHSSRDLSATGSGGMSSQQRTEPAFDRPPPYTLGRAPILRVFVQIGTEKVPKWPSKEGAAACWHQLEKCGASKKLKLGDLVVNTALRHPTNTEHVLVFVPFTKHLLVPLQYTHCLTGHLPHYVDGLSLPPSYYYPFLPAPQIIYLDLAPFAQRAIGSIRLAYDRRDVTVASGARLSAKRYLHVAGLEVRPEDRVASEWTGMVSLEAEGTAEGRMDLESRLGWGNPQRAVMGPWEVVREKSMPGTVWLRLIKEVPRG